MKFRKGERVFLYKPAEKSGQARKFTRPFHGPYWIVEIDSSTAQICRVDEPDGSPFLLLWRGFSGVQKRLETRAGPPLKSKGRAQKKVTANSQCAMLHHHQNRMTVQLEERIPLLARTLMQQPGRRQLDRWCSIGCRAPDRGSSAGAWHRECSGRDGWAEPERSL